MAFSIITEIYPTLQLFVLRPSVIFIFTHAAQFALHLTGRLLRTALGQAGHESLQLQQVCDPKQRTLPAHDNFRIRGYEVRPLRGDGAKGCIIDLQQKPLAVSVKSLAYADEGLAREWMERVRYPYKTLRSD
jgi:hypothetical protein